MKPVDRIEEIIKKKLNARADAALHNRVLERVREAKAQYEETMSPCRRKWITKNPSTRLASAAAIVAIAVLAVAAALLLGGREAPEPGPTKARPPVACALRLATALSLEKAFRSGGMQAMEEQYRRAYGSPRGDTENPSVEELMAELETETRKSGG